MHYEFIDPGGEGNGGERDEHGGKCWAIMGEIEVLEGDLPETAGLKQKEFDEVTGTEIHWYCYWICVNYEDA